MADGLHSSESGLNPACGKASPCPLGKQEPSLTSPQQPWGQQVRVRSRDRMGSPSPRAWGRETTLLLGAQP